MVTRKNSLPYPQSPTASSTQATSTTAATAAFLDGASQSHPPTQNSFMDSDNPWQDHRSPTESGQGANHHNREHSLTNIPQALRPGESGQDTPRSSIDSGDSRDWWEDDDAGDKSPERSPVRAATKTPNHDIPAALRPRGPSPSAAPNSFGERDVFPATAPDAFRLQDPSAAPHNVGSSPTGVKRKPLPVSQHLSQDTIPSQPDFASNNPFRSASEAPPPPTAAPPPIPTVSPWEYPEQETIGKGKTPVRDPEFSASITDFSRMTISGDRPDPSAYQKVQTPQERDDPWKSYDSPSAPPVPSTQTLPPSQHEVEDPWKQFDEHPAQSPPYTPQSQPFQSVAQQPALTPMPRTNSHQGSNNLWPESQTPHATPTEIRPDAPAYSNTVHAGQETGSVTATPQVPRISHSRTTSQQVEPSLIDDDDFVPPQPVRPVQTGKMQQEQIYAPPPGPPPGHSSVKNTEGIPPPKPPRPAVITRQLTEQEQAQATEQRNETYQIKHFNWFDHTSGRLRRSSMLTQNKNGPCPLLALVNALILGAKDESQAALDDALRSREQVSLGLIIETLMYELVDRSANNGVQLPDVDDLNAFLMRLRTGMNANPRFVPQKEATPNLMDARNSMLHMPQQQRAQMKAGTFEMTGDIKLYGSFSVPLLHGWIPDPGSDAEHAFARSAQTYEDAQAIQFGEEELEYKLTRGGLSPDEQRVWEDITSIKQFFRSHPTQLTSCGLENIQQSLSSGSFAILFRNDHFSTVYKHPQSGQLFTLITDAGYADRDEIIWESLVDISGHANDFFSGDFMPVSHQQALNASSNSNTHQQQHLSVDDPHSAGPLSPQQQQEQHDADFAMALQLQEEEEQRSRAEAARRRRSAGQAGPGSNNASTTALAPGQSPRGSNGGNIPITLTRSRQSQSDAPENRPSVPPRRSQAPPTTNRPTDANDEDAPPAYEEAAKGRPYVPPVGSPLHPTSGPDSNSSPGSSSLQLSGTVSNSGGGNGGSGNGGGSSSLGAHPPGPNAPYYSPAGQPGQQQQRPGGHGRVQSSNMGRLSAYQDQNARPGYGPMPGSYQSQASVATGMPEVSSGGRRRRSDCVVM